MTYGTPRTLSRRPVLLSLLPPPEPKPRPTMTWAQMAAAEGHRPRMPGDPIAAEPRVPAPPPVLTDIAAVRRILRQLAAGPAPRGDLNLGRTTRAHIPRLLAAGLIEEVPAPLPCHPRRVVLALTPAGRAYGEAAE